MINIVLYGVLMFCCFVAIVTGRRTLIYASALLMPAIQVMPSLVGPPTSAPNLIVLGLIAGAFFHSRRTERQGPAHGAAAGALRGRQRFWGTAPRSESGVPFPESEIEPDGGVLGPGDVTDAGPFTRAVPPLSAEPRDTSAAPGLSSAVPGGSAPPGSVPGLPAEPAPVPPARLAPEPRPLPEVVRQAPSFVRASDIRGAGLGAGFSGGGSVAADAGGALVAEAPGPWSAYAQRAAASTKLPLRGAILFLTLMLLLGLAIRGLNEQSGHEYLNPFSRAAKDTWYRITPFLVYALIFRQLLAEPTDKVLRRIVLLCQISFVVECAITMVELALGIGRATAHLEEANRAGAFFAAASAFFFASFLMRTGKWRWLSFGGWILAVGAVFNSLSRGAMAASAVSCLVVLVFAFFTGRLSGGTKLLLVVLLVVAAVNAPFLVPQRVKTRVLATFGGESPTAGAEVDLDASAEERLLLWSIGWMLVKDNPFGYGALTYQDLVLPYHDKAKVAHNIYLQVLVENGVEGLVALLILVAAVLALLVRSYFRARSHDQAVLALCLIGWWTAHLAAHFFVNSFFHLQVTGQFWMMLACLFALQVTGTEHAGAGRPAQSPAEAGPAPPLGSHAWS